MSGALHTRLGRLGVPVPSWLWHRAVRQAAKGMQRVYGSLAPDERRVREWLVTTLADRGAPIAPGSIASELALDSGRVGAILDRLERKLVFLARDARGAVSWAYPVTVDATPHQLAFKTGERMTAA